LEIGLVLTVFLLLVLSDDLQTLPGFGVTFVKALMKGAQGRQLFGHDGDDLGLGIAAGDGQKKE